MSLAVASIVATACILFPKPKHLARNAFFGTFSFVLGGIIGSTITIILLSNAVVTTSSWLQRNDIVQAIAKYVAFVFFGSLSAWITLKSIQLLSFAIKKA
jgi:hypothetical protein